ncbi:lipoyl(octanoyl) transferase LipB [Thermosynechococcaceae cyanobacterium BACA0444]|uniref:Octanoyltransferase n=1 Tax=Pseudocalidococcus azoricus BACA0444 TaxID=2918990 RepID=A0AAE4FNJ5_9CYAN|nr:lipoyl(octanoyl) transferase LipB [Pseudocalidococcus azoricus]MDS3859383.1 lipoyl(octanoyl) transferase LipB [Pseudocalidococcus azoricus BACA0444]
MTALSHPPHNRNPCYLYQAPLIPYSQAWTVQKQLVAARHTHPALPDALILCQHPPVYTLGQGATLAHLNFDPQSPPAPLYRIERGGEVTHHCPGQVILYPILNLRRYQTDLHWYLRQLEEIVIQALAVFGIPGERWPGMTGVWVKGHKVAAIGIKVSRWITMHGLAVNVAADLSGFQAIIPCGISQYPVANVRQFIPEITVDQVQAALLQVTAALLRLKFQPQPWPQTGCDNVNRSCQNKT